MLGHIEIVLIYLKKKFSIKAKKKLVPTKLRAVLACPELTPRSVSQLWISAKNFEKSTCFS